MYAEPRHRPIPLEAETLLQEGRLSEAIKVLRDSEQLSHKEARRRIDAYIAGEPLLQAQLELRQRAARRRMFLWFLALDALIVAAIVYWFFYRVPA